MRKARKKFITAEFNERVSHNLEVLAKLLGIQLKEIKRWRREGLISYPVLETEFYFIVKMVNTIWGNYTALRCQMTVMTTAKRQNIVRTADLSGIELEVFNLVLRWKLQFPRRYLHFNAARNQLRARFPNGYMQLNGKLLCRAKKAANYVIAKAKKTDGMDQLLKQVNLQVIDGKIQPKKATVGGSESPTESPNDIVEYKQVAGKDTSVLPCLGRETTTTATTKEQKHKGLTGKEIEYLEEHFSDSYEKGKKLLQDRLKCILSSSSKKS
jgi:hypothetical protein